MKLSIGENILKYRKEKGYTQEDVANALHISCAAVSKWETQASYPDITLLQPLARLFEISLDNLLNFSLTLSDQEVREMQVNCQLEFQKGDIQKAYIYCENLLKEYPHCDMLTLAIASLYNYQSLIHLEYDKDTIQQLHVRSSVLLKELCHSQTASIAESATVLVATIYQQEGDYDQAIELLKPKVQGLDLSLNIASLYHLKNEDETAIQFIQRSILLTCSNLSQAMGQLSHYLNEDDISYRIIQDLNTFSSIFNQPLLHSSSALMEIEYYSKRKDKEATIKALTRYIQNFQKEPEPSIYFGSILTKQTLLEMNYVLSSFLNEEKMLDFLREDQAFQDILKQIKKS